MPEMRFHIRWPDGTGEACYSPSLVIKDFFSPGRSYPLAEFLRLSRTALNIASDRVEAKYGRACSLAAAQLSHLETVAERFADSPEAQVVVEAFETSGAPS